MKLPTPVQFWVRNPNTRKWTLLTFRYTEDREAIIYDEVTDEGWISARTGFYIMNGYVYRTYTWSAADCDSKYSRTTYSRWPVGGPLTPGRKPDDPPTPEWEDDPDMPNHWNDSAATRANY